VQHTALARDFVHEALTRRDGADAPPSLAVRNRLRSCATDVGERFGGSHLGEQLETAILGMTDEFMGLVATTACPTSSGRSANDRLLSFQRAASAVADALAEGARRRHFEAPYSDASAVHSTVTTPYVALVLEMTTEYALKHYEESLDAYMRLLAHVTDALGPFFDMLVTPASSTKLGVLKLLRASVKE